MARYAFLECGCVVGHRLCPTAVALWNAGNAAYATWQAVLPQGAEENWNAYQDALEHYTNHYGMSVRRREQVHNGNTY